jgi:hypothetical protein
MGTKMKDSDETTCIIQEGRKRGRKPGKHSSERYTQASVYLPVELRNQVRATLYEKGMEMSGLVEDLLQNWLSSQCRALPALNIDRTDRSTE